MNTATQTAITALAPVVERAINKHLSEAPIALMEARDIKTELVKEAAAVVVNQTNAEPWYRSNVTMGILLTAAATIAKPWAPDLVPFLQDPDTAAAVVTIIQGAGLLWSFAGRWWIKKPIGA